MLTIRIPVKIYRTIAARFTHTNVESLIKSPPHSFVRAPHRTLLRLSVPVMISLIAEPVTGLIDTAFIARLGSVPMAALGVGTIALSSVFWIFNFLGIATQTDVAKAAGGGNTRIAKEHAGLSMILAVVLGLICMLLLFLVVPVISGLMGAEGDVQRDADLYIRIRLLGMPAVLVTVAGFGALRGIQDMKSPLWIAVGLNAINLVLDPILIFGLGGIEAMGIEGAAIASLVAQWAGAAATITMVVRRIGIVIRFDWSRTKQLFRTGRDLFVRTAMLTLFLVVATRQATRMGPDAGAVHQGIRQFWMISVLLLDGFAVSGQSLVAYFLGSSNVQIARKVAATVCLWSLGAGAVLGAAMWMGSSLVETMLIPRAAQDLFRSPWLAAILIQPVSALTFATDGIHWGTGDFRFLRNVTTLATLVGISGLLLLDLTPETGLFWIWTITGIWIVVRAAFGTVRIWPGLWGSPLNI